MFQAAGLFACRLPLEDEGMLFFKSRYESEMDQIINKMEMNLSNNYKDNAQSDLRDLIEVYTEYKDKGLLKEKVASKYEDIIETYKVRLKGYAHKDQKPFWT